MSDIARTSRSTTCKRRTGVESEALAGWQHKPPNVLSSYPRYRPRPAVRLCASTSYCSLYCLRLYHLE